MIDRPQRRGRAGRSATMTQALEAISDRSRFFIPGGSAVPTAILEAMTVEHDRWSAIEFVADYLLEPLPVFDHPNDPFTLTSLQPSRALASMVEAGAFTSAASALTTWAGLLAPTGALALDATIIHVSPPGPDGRFSLGVNTVTPLDAMASSTLVIAQVNPQMPYTFGAAEIERDEVDLFVEVDHPLVEFPAITPDETTRQVGANVARLVANGSMLQLGLGALPDVVCAELANHRDLGIHSGMVSDGLIALQASGALTGSKHPDFPGKIVTAMIGGTRTLLDFVDRNPDIVMVPPTITHGFAAIGRLDQFTAINSAIEVALDGSINCERVGDRVISGPGGSPDYAAIAHATEGGRFIVALPSTAARRTLSRIVPELRVPATVAGPLVDIVVTEHGVADFTGLDSAARANALRSVADLAFAESLS
ncbi:MAG: acetyl-CoA hydrolase/transferase family protein [Acidimicrobiales bacterium]